MLERPLTERLRIYKEFLDQGIDNLRKRLPYNEERSLQPFATSSDDPYVCDIKKTLVGYLTARIKLMELFPETRMVESTKD